MHFQPSDKSKKWHDRARSFFHTEILPRHREWTYRVARNGGDAAFIDDLKDKARKQGLWNLGLPGLRDDEPGTHLTNLEFAPIAELLGRLPWASGIFNCQAPDLPNMAMLHALATPAQHEKWLMPMLEGKTRSAFAMTEPDVASSDATNIATRMEIGDDTIRIDGSKWFATGAAHPDCDFLIVMGVSNPDTDRMGQHSMAIVPMDTPGVVMERELSYMGWRDHAAPIGQLRLENVEVPRANLVGEVGQGFAGAQIRLGPARIHHCMRCIGMAEMLVEQMIARASERETFGRSVIDYDTVQGWIAEARVAIEQTRLFILKAAWMVDEGEALPNKTDVWRQVSMIKIATPTMLQHIADRALQVFGAMGGTDDTLIHHAFAYARWFRIGDGPDEVHKRQIFKTEPKPDWSIADCPYITPPADAARQTVQKVAAE